MARRHRLRNRPVRRRVARSRVGVGAMQIKIEIDVRPEELRRFLGLPDVAGLQEDVVAFLRDKVGAATEFDPSQFVKSNFDVLRKTPAWKRSEEHTSELQSLMRISYAVFCLKKKNKQNTKK